MIVRGIPGLAAISSIDEDSLSMQDIRPKTLESEMNETIDSSNEMYEDLLDSLKESVPLNTDLLIVKLDKLKEIQDEIDQKLQREIEYKKKLEEEALRKKLEEEANRKRQEQ